VSVAYGLNQGAAAPAAGGLNLGAEVLSPTLEQTIQQYNKLRTATIPSGARVGTRRWLVNTTPALWPVMGRLLSHYGQRTDPFQGGQAFHAGVDISAGVGTPVRVAADGVVIAADWGGAYGKVVVVDHGNGLQTLYAHLSRIDVIPGQEVRLGQVIAGSGATGRVTSPHLHYEVRRGGAPVNPYTYLAKSALTASNPTKDFGF